MNWVKQNNKKSYWGDPLSMGRRILNILLATMGTGITNPSITVMQAAGCISMNTSGGLACAQAQLFLSTYLD